MSNNAMFILTVDDATHAVYEPYWATCIEIGDTKYNTIFSLDV